MISEFVKGLKNNLCDCDYRLTDKNDVEPVGLNGKSFYPGTQTAHTGAYN